jgi:hypothetical protein
LETIHLELTHMKTAELVTVCPYYILRDKEIGWRGVEWFQLAQVTGQWLAVVNTVMNLRVLAPWS